LFALHFYATYKPVGHRNDTNRHSFAVGVSLDLDVLKTAGSEQTVDQCAGVGSVKGNSFFKYFQLSEIGGVQCLRGRLVGDAGDWQPLESTRLCHSRLTAE